MPIAVPPIRPTIRSAIIGIARTVGRPVIGTVSIVAGTIAVSVTRTVIAVSAGGACRDRAGCQAKGEPGSNSARLGRRRDGGCANCGNRRQNCQCLLHARSFISSTHISTRGHRDGCSGNPEEFEACREPNEKERPDWTAPFLGSTNRRHFI